MGWVANGMTQEQSYAILLSVGVASMMFPIMLALVRIANARRNDR